MPYNSIVDRTDAGVLIPEQTSSEIIKATTAQSAVLSLARKLPNMTRKQQNLPVLSALANAYFVNSDAGLKQTTEVAWDKKVIYAEELAVIVPIPEAVLSDTDYDLWAEIKPQLVEAFGRTIDAAVLYGANKPALWPDGIVAGATAAGNTVAVGTGKDLYHDIMGEAGLLAALEADGYNATGHVAAMSMKSKLRGLRDANGVPIFLPVMQGKANYQLDGTDIAFPTNGAINPAQSLLVSGDWNQLVYSIRQDITYKIFDSGVVQDADGKIVYNLMQQDMVALRAVMRLGWQLPNPINRLNENSATRYPFAVLTA